MIQAKIKNSSRDNPNPKDKLEEQQANDPLQDMNSELVETPALNKSETNTKSANAAAVEVNHNLSPASDVTTKPNLQLTANITSEAQSISHTQTSTPQNRIPSPYRYHNSTENFYTPSKKNNSSESEQEDDVFPTAEYETSRSTLSFNTESTESKNLSLKSIRNDENENQNKSKIEHLLEILDEATNNSQWKEYSKYRTKQLDSETSEETGDQTSTAEQTGDLTESNISSQLQWKNELHNSLKYIAQSKTSTPINIQQPKLVLPGGKRICEKPCSEKFKVFKQPKKVLRKPTQFTTSRKRLNKIRKQRRTIGTLTSLIQYYQNTQTKLINDIRAIDEKLNKLTRMNKTASPKISHKKEGKVEKSTQTENAGTYRERRKEKVCFWYINSTCKFRSKCRNYHPTGTGDERRNEK